ncbi:unnamed protein product [Gadus morhua 'NCC']
MRDPGPSAGLNYEQQILELEQKLVQRQNPEGAAPPPCPSVGGSEQQSVTEAQRSVELEREQEVRAGFKVALTTRHREAATEQMKMNPWTLSVLLLLAGPLGADPDWHVEYPDSFCVVEGSTATIPCSFTHPKVHERTGVVVERVERVVWCTNNEFCLTTANVHGSSNLIVAQRFQYLGDRVRKCTLKIIKTVKQDAATYRFRFETNADKYAGRKGVVVTVTDGEVVKVRSSVTDHVVKEGGQVPLTCTSACSFDQLDVHWYRNGHALSETGPALHPSNLTNGDTGNYTCSLDSSGKKTSAPWCLVVMESRFDWHLTVSVVLKVLWAVFLLLLAGLVFAKRSAPGPEHEIVYSEEGPYTTMHPWTCNHGDHILTTAVVLKETQEGPYTTMHPWTCNHGDHILTTAVVLKETQPISPPPVQVALITRHRQAATEQMKINPWTLSVLLLLAGPLGADPDWHVEYPDSFCVVEGSTATIPCSFTHPKVHKGTGVVVERVVWCSDHEICHGTTPNSRFLYLGDLVGNCTLKIIKTVKRDAETYRFRIETNGGGWTGPKGVRVNVTVKYGEDVKVRSSATDNVVKKGGQVTLTCTSACSFHQLDIHWYRNGHNLSETGPSLHLSSLTNNNTGNYTCSLDSSGQNTSAPWSLVVVEDEGKHNVTVTGNEKSGWLLSVSVLSLAVVLLLLAGLVFVKRRQAQKKASDVIQKLEVDCKQEAVGASEEVSYSTVHFKRNSSRSAPGPEHEIVYSEEGPYTTMHPWTCNHGDHIMTTAATQVRSSVTDNVVKEGGQVTLTCTSACSFHQLDVLWYRNGHALSETGPSLHLSCLTNDVAGDYTCSLDSRDRKPLRLGVCRVGNEDKSGRGWRVTVPVVSVLLAVFLLLLAGLVFAKRHREEATEQMKMNPWTLSVLLLLAGPLGADPDWHVEYPDSFCVVEGSTATIPCSFTHPTVHKRTGAVVERVERVVWCPDHPICHGTTPNVYNSSSVRADSRFLYLGDLVRNCTLKIIKTEKQDAATYRFRFETNGGGFAGKKGVRVNVTNGEDVKVRSSVTDNVVKEGGQVTLTCTSACSFHQLDVHWCRNGHALSETGPALHFSNLTNNNTGNYTCSLDSCGLKTSAPWRLVVMERLALEAVGGGKTRSGAALQMLKGTEATQSEVPAVAVSGRCRDQPAPRPGKGNSSDRLKVR